MKNRWLARARVVRRFLPGPVARVVTAYALFAGLWILLSDTVLALLTADADAVVRWSIYKGWAFVAVTALLLAGLLRVEFHARERMQVALRRSAERLRFALQMSHTGGWELDVAEQTVERTADHDRIFGYPSLLPRWTVAMFLEHVVPEDRAGVERQMVQAVSATSNWTAECRIRRADGELRWIRISGGNQHDASGQVRRVAGILQDVTDLKRAEEERKRLDSQLTQAQKMESVGRLAGGVAHDLNNTLSVVLGHSELALLSANAQGEVRGHLEGIREAAAHSAKLTRQLLAFARRQTIAPRVLDLNETVAGLLDMLRRLIGEDVRLAWRPGPGLRHVKIDPSQLDQVLFNLVVNARDAIAGVGSVTVETANVRVQVPPGWGQAAAPGEYVQLAVQDDGCGMEAAVLERLFEPFFTTKPVGRGTGLGLATVYGIVQQNGGFLDVRSAPGQGSRFEVHLPATDERAEPPGPGEAEVPRGSGETVLLVEDEAATLRALSGLLTELGYSVLAAAGPAEARRVAEGHAGPIHLLMTDVIMPEMNGRELAERLATLRPGLPCLFVSGHTADILAPHGVLEPGLQFLSKPFSRGELALKLRDVIDRVANKARARCVRYSMRLDAAPIALLAALLVLAASPAPAQATLDAQEMDRFLAGFFQDELARAHCPGAIVAVVKDGHVLLMRGFGDADPVRRVPSSPETDRFYVGSISKLFTATAAMQLSDRGTVSLQDDVGRYLGEGRIEPRFGQPVTLEHLLTHRSGIEDLFVIGGRPRRVRPPGEVISYSNHDLDLVGEVIASASGVPFAQYVERNVLGPLGMTRSTFERREDLGVPVGWRYTGEGYVPQPWNFDRAIPSATLSSTAADMAAFALAHLQDGEYRGTRILNAETARLMRRQHASNHPALGGVGLAFWEWERNGLRGVEHKGDTAGYEAGLFLCPSERLGLFVSYNSQTRESPDRLFRAFFDHYYPPPTGADAQPSAVRTDLARFAGTYRWTRCPATTLGKLIAAGIEGHVSVVAGRLHAEFVFLPIAPADYSAVAPLVFRGPGPTGERLAFREERDGRISYMFTGPLAFERLPWYQGARAVTFFGVGFNIIFLVVSLALPIRAVARLRRGKGAPLLALRRATWASAALNLVFLVGVTIVLIGMLRSESFWNVPLALELLLVIPLVTSPLAGVLLALNARAWALRLGSARLRVAYGLYALCAVAFVPYLVFWNLIGFNY